MWSDNETSEDLLGFKVHADLLVDVIKDDALLPITIGVFGDWGSGKSSILKIINDELSGDDDELKDGTLVLYFNGWVFEGYDDAKSALLETIVERFAKHKTLGNKVKDSTVKLSKSVNWMRVAKLGLKNIVIPGATALLTGGTSLVPHLIGKFADFKPADLAAKLSGEDSGKFLEGIMKDVPEETMLVREFRDDFDEMIRKSEIKKLLVIIDDLDRCSPDRIIENLEAIKLFLNVEKTAFIIGADPRIVRHAIEFRYKTDSIQRADDRETRNRRIVSDYLEKLIQLPYNLPRLSDSEVETYMTLLFCKISLEGSYSSVLEKFSKQREENRYGTFGFGDIDDLITSKEREKLNNSISLIASLSSIITAGLNGNPRQVKRFLNTFMLRSRLVKVAKISDFKFDVLAKLMVLEYSASSLFRQLHQWQATQSGEPKEISELEQLVEDKDIASIVSNYKDWSVPEVVQWIAASPKLTGIDLRDYYWISRDQLSSSISGSSLVPTFLRILARSLLDHGSGTILKDIADNKVKTVLTATERETLFSLIEKEIVKSPENTTYHKVFIQFIESEVIGAIDAYERLLIKIDHDKVPFSLGSLYKLAERKNAEIARIYKLFKGTSGIYKAIHRKK
ncbi:KAP family P-loop NTPase fold protein [Pedobacter africanus]|uniref:Predicted P-loop ATPase, KAP-like n=1 Tax=Pedobacter africanus TaxID=151894 RepID=A0A1W2CS39_9SPHI|nr:P-loop NTPase fold protein [Pedobacter africanus]SMC87776.1 Predicted P-loop ATPase, KAP-like [Pedobacter africanus]